MKSLIAGKEKSRTLSRGSLESEQDTVCGWRRRRENVLCDDVMMLKKMYNTTCYVHISTLMEAIIRCKNRLDEAH